MSDVEEPIEQALGLLLRSPKLSVSQILELLDLGDREFKAICERNRAVAHLLEARRRGELEELSNRERSERLCLTCGETFEPYANARYCSDTCARLALVRTRSAKTPRVPPRSD
ncbi:MAG: hypothetical protein AAGI15_13750 [Pseudomonadota bacterium]